MDGFRACRVIPDGSKLGACPSRHPDTPVCEISCEAAPAQWEVIYLSLHILTQAALHAMQHDRAFYLTGNIISSQVLSYVPLHNAFCTGHLSQKLTFSRRDPKPALPATEGVFPL